MNNYIKYEYYQFSIRLIKECKELLKNITPLKTDCGEKCDHMCCKPYLDDKGEEAGMILFPFEHVLYENEDWCRVKILEDGETRFLVCDKPCPRDKRPLSCMIYPLRCYFSDHTKEWRIVLDSRAKDSGCPLKYEDITEEFKETVAEVFSTLMITTENLDFIRWLSEVITLESLDQG